MKAYYGDSYVRYCINDPLNTLKIHGCRKAYVEDLVAKGFYIRFKTCNHPDKLASQTCSSDSEIQ